ncbi:hypothetical protein Ancab_031375 [Ancistrocladus abbreviatus]
MGVVNYLDTILVPLSLFLTIGYHACLWHHFKTNPSSTTIGINSLKRDWLLGIKEGDDKKEMLAVQSLRNTLMASILTASITILVTISLAALANNTYNATAIGHLFSSSLFGSQSGRIISLKYGSASVFLLISFLCSSIAVGFLIDANFLINASASSSDHSNQQVLSRQYAKMILERGSLFAVAGNRALYIAFPIILWLLGPVAVAVSSVAVVCGLYELDFSRSSVKRQ